MSFTNEELYQLDRENYLPTFKRFPLAFSKGKGSKLYDVEGKEYIDLLAGIAVCNVGHCHPDVVSAVQKQAAELMHISNFFVTPAQVELSKKLNTISGLDHTFITNSGAESVEGAIKVARKYAHKNGRGGEVISMTKSFHGRTLGTIATGQAKYQKGFEPIPSGFKQVEFNDWHTLKSMITNETAAIILEPVQGEGGINPVNKEFLKNVRELCDQEGIALIFDEVQCGIGRTGKWFAKDHYGIQPDIMSLAKGLGGGFPVGAFLCSAKIGEAIDFGDHGTTFGGNPLACSAALATLSVIEKENLIEEAVKKGEWIKAEFEKMKSTHPEIKEIRGLGLMLGIELSQPAAPLVKMLLERGIIANATADTVLRLVPALNIPMDDLKAVMKEIDKCLLEMVVEHG
ncbi:aspartate aminotransferase family protein [Fulvivirga ligni]|uniref:aspartate aminotransferase family protein n=1 Tax=Fulvivirga ligni TaxID=2904246 RepID=UPI001F2FC071|nr:aspartate aminotransferase family protein [Fulvivirga ligni]UII23520.1 aspartate aminotransferase family protein [Fulvivirga ligni]